MEKCLSYRSLEQHLPAHKKLQKEEEGVVANKSVNWQRGNCLLQKSNEKGVSFSDSDFSVPDAPIK